MKTKGRDERDIDQVGMARKTIREMRDTDHGKMRTAMGKVISTTHEGM
jgi:hypothetical protein